MHLDLKSVIDDNELLVSYYSFGHTWLTYCFSPLNSMLIWKFRHSQYILIVLCSILFRTVSYHPLWFVSFPSVGVLFHCSNSSPIFPFSFSHFVSGQFSLVHLSPVPFVFHPSLSCTTCLGYICPFLVQLHTLVVLTDLNAFIPPVCV